MINSIEMSKEEMDVFMKALPKDLRDQIMAKIKPSSGIEIIREFVEKYEDHDMSDHIIAHTASNLIRKITTIAYNLSKDKRKKGDGRISTIEMGFIVSETLKAEAQHILDAISEHQEECKTKECGASH